MPIKYVGLLQVSHLSVFATCYYLLIKSNLMIKCSNSTTDNNCNVWIQLKCICHLYCMKVGCYASHISLKYILHWSMFDFPIICLMPRFTHKSSHQSSTLISHLNFKFYYIYTGNMKILLLFLQWVYIGFCHVSTFW